MTKDELVLDTIKLPVVYDPESQSVFDADNNQVTDIRGWGRIQYLSQAEERQDAIGEMIANSINKYYEQTRQN